MSRLMQLPAELRNRIYEFTLYHDETAGLIAPAHAGLPEAASSKAFIDGAWRSGTLFRNKVTTANVTSLTKAGFTRYFVEQKLRQSVARSGGTHGGSAVQAASHYLVDRFFFYKTDQATVITATGRGLQHVHEGHICTAGCVLQPALTRTSRQVRDECLYLFYGANEFRFHAPGLERIMIDRGAQMPEQAAVLMRWWRSIGDTHLRSLTSLRIDSSGVFELTASSSGEVRRVCLEGSDIGYVLQNGAWAQAEGSGPDVSANTDEEQSWIAKIAHQPNGGQAGETLARRLADGRLCVLLLEEAMPMVNRWWEYLMEDRSDRPVLVGDWDDWYDLS